MQVQTLRIPVCSFYDRERCDDRFSRKKSDSNLFATSSLNVDVNLDPLSPQGTSLQTK